MENTEQQLWCVHVIGPDDIEARPSLEDANRRAAELNHLFASWEQTENTPEIRAVVEPYPYSPESHAEELAKEKQGQQ